MLETERFAVAIRREIKADLEIKLLARDVRMTQTDMNLLIEAEVDQIARFLYDLYMKAWRK